MGNTKYNDQFLNRFHEGQEGDVYNKEALEQALSYDPNGGDIMSLYMDDGYLFFDVVPVEMKVRIRFHRHADPDA